MKEAREQPVWASGGRIDQAKGMLNLKAQWGAWREEVMGAVGERELLQPVVFMEALICGHHKAWASPHHFTVWSQEARSGWRVVDDTKYWIFA